MENPNEKFGHIYDQYIEKIYRFVYLKVNSQESAEDITSKVFLNGWQYYQRQPDKIQNMSAFLYQTARNMVVDHYREKDRVKFASTDELPPIADKSIDLHEKAIVSADVEEVKAAMQNIKKDYQDVLIWHYLDDMPIEEICQILNKSNGAVRVMIHRGLNALKKEMGQMS